MGNTGICVVNNTDFTLDCYLSMGAPHYRCNGLAPNEAFVIYPGAVWYTVGAKLAKESSSDAPGAVMDLTVGRQVSGRWEKTLIMERVDKKECWMKSVYGGKKGGFFVEAQMMSIDNGKSFKFQMVETTGENVLKTLKKSPFCWRKRSASDKKEYWSEDDGSYYPPKAWKLAD